MEASKKCFQRNVVSGNSDACKHMQIILLVFDISQKHVDRYIEN